MAKQYLRQQALSHLSLEQAGSAVLAPAGLDIWQEPPRWQYALRGDGDDKGFVAAVKKTLGLPLPVKANTVSGDEKAALLWLGPDEWLYSAIDTGQQWDGKAALEAACADQYILVSDVSNSRCVLGLAGDNARAVLMQGTSLDVHPQLFGPGQCAQSAFARCHVLLQPIDKKSGYHLYVHRSFADYLYRWLLDVAQRFAAGAV